MIDDGAGNGPEGVVHVMDVPARPERAGLAQCLLDIEQELVSRDGAEIVVHVPSMA